MVCVIGVVTTVAGLTADEGYGYADGNGTVAKLYNPTGIAVDPEGDVWIADKENHMIRRINATTGRLLLS